MAYDAVDRRFGTIDHAVIPEDAGDAQSIIREDTRASSRLRGAVRCSVAPFLHCAFITEERQGDHSVRRGHALKALDRQETVDGFQLAAQRGSERQILVGLPFRQIDLENNGDHGLTKGAWGSEASRRNVRSSRKMKRSRLANA